MESENQAEFLNWAGVGWVQAEENADSARLHAPLLPLLYPFEKLFQAVKRHSSALSFFFFAFCFLFLSMPAKLIIAAGKLGQTAVSLKAMLFQVVLNKDFKTSVYD